MSDQTIQQEPTTEELNSALATVQRMVDSQQPAYGGTAKSEAAVGAFDFGSLLRWADASPPAYGEDVRKYDRWHADFLRSEPHLMGVVGQAVSIIGNRGFSIVGGKIQVNRTKAIFDGANRKVGAPFGDGYRQYIRRLARSFYWASFGAPTELGRDSAPVIVGGVEQAGPLRAIWSADPTKFKMRTRNSADFPISAYPYSYHPSGGKVQYWRHTDLMRITDNTSALDEYAGIGISAVAILREIAEIMVAVYRYDKEKLGAVAPNGLLILDNITQESWKNAMSSRKSKLEGLNRQRYGGLAVLSAPTGLTGNAKLMALSSLPDNFNRKEMIDMMMYLYALVLKFSPDEFWPVAGGGIGGRNGEVAMGFERDSRKGDGDFFNDFQSQIGLYLPKSILFQYEEGDVRGDKVKAEADKLYVDMAVAMYQAGTGSEDGERLLDKQKTLSFLALKGVIPPEWSEAEETTLATDTSVARLNHLRDELMDTSHQVQRALEFQGIAVERSLTSRSDYDVVRFAYPSNHTQVLWRASEWPHYGNRYHPVTRVVERAVLYRDPDDDFVITDANVDTAIADVGERLGDDYAFQLQGGEVE